MSRVPTHNEIVEFLRNRINGDIKSISIIGSYLIDMRLREGSDIDLVVLVSSLEDTQVEIGDIFYKDTVIEDSQGKRKELNTKLQGVTLDITVIDPSSTNPPNNPLTDYYENFLGLCISGHAIYGESLSKLLDADKKIADYETVRLKRLELVKEKIQMTKRKIREQGRQDLHILYELQRYVFIRECISRKLFNRLSIKHVDKLIPEFESIYGRELSECGLEFIVKKLNIT